jgi:hypothetical protein
MRILVVFFLFIFQSKAYAVLAFDDHAFPELITSSRALALGNSYMCKVDDPWSAFYNPAGLGTFRGFMFHLTNLHLEMNNGFKDIVGEGNVGGVSGNFSKALTATGVRELLADNPGTTSHARLNFFPNMTFRGLTLGYVYSQQSRARLQSSTSDLELAERKDVGPMMGLNISLFGGIIKIGAAATILTRKEFQKDFAQTESIVIDEDLDYKQGTMTHVVAGTRITLPIATLPTFSVVSRNASNAKFSQPDLGGLPNEVPQTVDYGFSITPHLGRTVRLHLEASYKDAANKYEMPANRRTGFGMEIDFSRVMFIRAGYGDGWGSGGIGVRNNEFIFDLTSYAIEMTTIDEETGEVDVTNRQNEDRRTVLSFSMGI